MFLDGPTSVAPLALGTAVPITALSSGSFRAFSVTPTNGKIYWGGKDVSIANGQPVVAGATLTIATKHPEHYWLVADSGTVDVRLCLYTGVG